MVNVTEEQKRIYREEGYLILRKVGHSSTRGCKIAFSVYLILLNLLKRALSMFQRKHLPIIQNDMIR